MKRQFSLLAVCLCGIGFANAQTTTNTYSTTGATTNASYTSPVTTDSTNSTNNTSSSMNTNNSTTPNTTYSTNSTPTDVTTTTTTVDNDRPDRVKATKDYKNFVFGIYAGLNSTKLKGEATGGDISGRLGYQAGFFVRGGGRIYGQIGAEYMTSSSEFYKPGDGATIKDITANVDQKYIQVPALIGVKLAQSDRGVSAVRLAVGAEYAAPLGVNNNAFNFQSGDFRAATVNGLVNLGFDAGPLLIGFMYHYGFADVIEGTSNTKRRILSVNVGVKF
ncbi:MAG: PorT family protein [Cytophagaceae bacterium]|nr:MAG: PorT family protein [Cytophagaceae bacterium]